MVSHREVRFDGLRAVADAVAHVLFARQARVAADFGRHGIPGSLLASDVGAVTADQARRIASGDGARQAEQVASSRRWGVAGP